jgi:hypothetical protein
VGLSKDVQKLKALRVAEFRLGQKFDYIDYVEDELKPEIAAALGGKPVLGLDAATKFTFEVVNDADPDQA